jgi:hypothetical protein
MGAQMPLMGKDLAMPLDLLPAILKLADASPSEAHDFMVTNDWLLASHVDDALSEMLTVARRQGDGKRAEALERSRRLLQRSREYGPNRVYVRDILDGVTPHPVNLVEVLQTVPANELQAELRRRIDGSIEIGDYIAWDHWVNISILLEQTERGTPLEVVTDAGANATLEAQWAWDFIYERDDSAQLTMLQERELPLPPSLIDRIRANLKLANLIATGERDALEVIRLRRTLGLVQVAADPDSDPALTEAVLTGRSGLFVKGPIA